jgi:Methyltransferase domain
MIPEEFSLPTRKWEMTNGERAAYVGTLAFVKPRLAVEIGSAMGGSLERTAAYSEHVHSFDQTEPGPAARALPNVTFHTGNSHKLLPAWLETVIGDGQVIDFAHVDGDHRPKGVAQDINDILSCPAFDGVMVMHDVMNQGVRDGLDMVKFEDYPDVVYVDYDFVRGYMSKKRGRNHLAMWGGIGLVIVDRSHQFKIREEYVSAGIRQDRFYDAHRLYRPLSDARQFVRRSGNWVRRRRPGHR